MTLKTFTMNDLNDPAISG